MKNIKDDKWQQNTQTELSPQENQQTDDNLSTESAPPKKGKTIVKEVKENRFATYFVKSTAQSKAFILENLRFSKIYFSILAAFLAIALTLIAVFAAFNSSQMRKLSKNVTQLNSMQNWLDEKNRQYLADVLQNPSIYYTLGSDRALENNFFEYSFTIRYDTTVRKYTDLTNVGYNPTFDVKGRDVVLEFNEKYTPKAKQFLDVKTLQMFSLFVSPLSSANNLTLRDYRTFLRVENVFGYLDDDGNENYTLTSETQINDDGNTYVIRLNEFAASTYADVPEINIVINFDSIKSIAGTFNSENYRALTTESDILLENNGFAMPISGAQSSETSQVLAFFNSYNSNFTQADLFEFTRDKLSINILTFKNLINAAIGQDGLLTAFSPLNRFYLDKAISGALPSLGQAGIDGLKNALKPFVAIDNAQAFLDKTQTELYQEFLLDVNSYILAFNYTEIDKIIADLAAVNFAFNLSDYQSIIKLYERFNKGAGQPLLETEIAKFKTYLAHIMLYKAELDIAKMQAANIINKVFAVNLNLNDATFFDLATNYNGGALSQEQIDKLSQLLALFDSPILSQAELAFYKLNSFVKSFEFDKKLSGSYINVRKAV